MVASSLLLALYAYPALVPAAPASLGEDLPFIFVLFLKEAFYGILMGTVAGVIFHGFQSAGSMIDNQRGVSIARMLIPQLGEQGSLSGNFLFQFSIVIYLAIGGHRLFFEAFFDSYTILPVLEFPVAGPGLIPMLDLMINVTGEVLYIAVQLAAPVIIAIFLADIILGIANRVAPQINVWELGFNVKGYVGILLLFVSITMIAKQFEFYSGKSQGYIRGLVRDLAKKPPVQPEFIAPPEEGLPKTGDSPPKVETLE
jgi:type III secretory pathway component EscT